MHYKIVAPPDMAEPSQDLAACRLVWLPTMKSDRYDLGLGPFADLIWVGVTRAPVSSAPFRNDSKAKC